MPPETIASLLSLLPLPLSALGGSVLTALVLNRMNHSLSERDKRAAEERTERDRLEALEREAVKNYRYATAKIAILLFAYFYQNQASGIRPVSDLEIRLLLDLKAECKHLQLNGAVEWWMAQILESHEKQNTRERK